MKYDQPQNLSDDSTIIIIKCLNAPILYIYIVICILLSIYYYIAIILLIYKHF